MRWRAATHISKQWGPLCRECYAYSKTLAGASEYLRVALDDFWMAVKTQRWEPTGTRVWQWLAVYSPAWWDDAWYHLFDWWDRTVYGEEFLQRICRRCGEKRYNHQHGRFGECNV